MISGSTSYNVIYTESAATPPHGFDTNSNMHATDEGLIRIFGLENNKKLNPS
jgi:hypothetical protein